MVFRMALSALLISAQVSFAQNATQRVIFPGDKLPAELTYKPLKLGSDVNLNSRDWFMLKDKNLAIANPAPGKSVEFSGPVLDNNNAQIYFRIVSGMILKESMIRMGMSPAGAVRYLEAVQESGQDFSATPLSKLGPLPKGLAELYENWDRPLYKMAVLPYLMLPLSVAYDQSHLQHFALAQVEDKASGKSCSAITTLWPLGPVQSRINERTKNLDALTTELRNAQARLQQSNMEQVRMTQEVRNYSGQIDSSLPCFSSITERVSRGGTMPTAACLTMAASVLEEAKLSGEWSAFVAKNLKNDEGDFSVRQRAEEKMKNLEARLIETQNLINSLKDSQSRQTQEQADAREKIAKLNVDLASQRAEEAKTSAEKKALQDEQTAIQNLDHALNTGTFSGTDSEKQTAVSATAQRATRLTQVRARLSQILQTEVKFQVNQAAIVRQIEFLQSVIDQKIAGLESIQSQMTDPASGLDAKLAALRAQVASATEVFLKASNEAKESEYVLSILNRRLSELSKFRDNLFTAVKKEEAQAEIYKKQIADAQKSLDTQSPGLSREMSELEAMIASYKDLSQMGWFLETDCPSRANFSQSEPGIYLSRAKLAPPPVAAPSAQNPSPKPVVTAADAGRWGLFNMDYAVFKAAIQNGVLLNVPGTVQLAVQQIIENYDFALAQQLDPATVKCQEADRSNAGNAMKVAFSVWSLGNDAQAKTKSVACRAANDVNAVNPARDYQASLAKLVAFEGSVLDQALPKLGQSHPKDLIEREAIQALGRELAPLVGLPRKGAADRDALIKALIRVLAADYNAESLKQHASSADASRFEFVFATEAPGGNFTGQLQEGAEYNVNTLAAIPLFSAPVNDSKYLANLTLSYGDKVKTLSGVRAGWVKVLAKQRELWMAARPLTSQVLTGEDGREITGFHKLSNCAEPRVVTLRARGNVVRMTSNLQTITDRRGVSRIDVARTSKVSPAHPGRSYIACEKFALNGATAAIRILEAQVIRARSGVTLYIPSEDAGGFILMNNQVVEGQTLNPETWSPR